MKTKVFAYGTLMKDCGNHHLLEGSKFLGPARTPPKFTMVSYGYFPAVLPEGATPITGEVYEVDEETLRSLDRLEGHPDWYCREEVVTDVCKAWMYVMRGERARPRSPIIESGSWRDR